MRLRRYFDAAPDVPDEALQEELLGTLSSGSFLKLGWRGGGYHVG
jgi:hypothetical protein